MIVSTRDNWRMKPGSVVVDAWRRDRRQRRNHGGRRLGWRNLILTNIPSRMPVHASEMYAKAC